MRRQGSRSHPLSRVLPLYSYKPLIVGFTLLSSAQPYVFQGQHVGPPRVWLRNEDAPGLCMTRAFGDQLAATVGVICEPEFTSVTLRPTDRRATACLCSRPPPQRRLRVHAEAILDSKLELLTPHPSVRFFACPPRYLIICSDGITEFFSSTDIVRLVHNAAGPRFGPKEAAQAIMTEARRRWVRRERRHRGLCLDLTVSWAVSA